MAEHPEERSLHYGGPYLDRAADRRFDPDWLSAAQAAPAARFLPMWRNRNHFRDDAGGPRVTLLDRDAVADLGGAADTVVFLGMVDGVPLFALDFSSRQTEGLAPVLASAGWQDLRVQGPSLGAAEAAWCAYARGMLHWHRAHAYCGYCGAPTRSERGGHVRLCTHADCGRQVHPRTDPAVIMLVERPATARRPAQCLLASHQRLPGPVYTTLAGFVEPGEQLEDTVIREVAEETSVPVSRVRYFGSQPWPFPAQLMLGFRATAGEADIRVDPEEIRDAQWFSRDALRAAGEWGDTRAALQLPRRDSIARQLIDAWLAEIDSAG